MTKRLEFLLGILVGGLFFAAGVIKIVQSPGLFADDVAKYGVLPTGLVNVFALILPWIEALAGGLLMAGIWKRAAAALIAGMNVIFIAAVIVAMERGLSVCGCFGASFARQVSGWTLLEDAVLLAAALWLWRRPEDKQENPK